MYVISCQFLNNWFCGLIRRIAPLVVSYDKQGILRTFSNSDPQGNQNTSFLHHLFSPHYLSPRLGMYDTQLLEFDCRKLSGTDPGKIEIHHVCIDRLNSRDFGCDTSMVLRSSNFMLDREKSTHELQRYSSLIRRQ